MDHALARCPTKNHNPILCSHIKVLALWKSLIWSQGEPSLADADKGVKLEVSEFSGEGYQ